MIQSALRMLAGEIRGMHSAALVLAGSAAASAVLALVRDRLLAYTFGAGAELDVYYAAFRVPDLIFVLAASLFSAYVLIPELSRRGGKEAEHRYMYTIVVGFSLMMGVVGLIAYVFSPALLKLFFPSLYMGDDGETLLFLTRLLLLQPIFLGFSNIWAAVTQYRHAYALYALAPIVYNVGIILGIIFLYPYFGLLGLGLGVVLGAFLHMAIQLPAVLKDGLFLESVSLESYRAVIQTAIVSLPRTLALSATHMVMLVLLVFAASLREGSVAVFSLAFNLQAVPLAIIGASYSVAAFPTLARMVADGNVTQFTEQLSSAARHILFWSVPALALLVVLRAHVVRAVLGAGNFDWTDTRLTAAILALFAFSLAAQALMLLLVRAYYAAGRSYTPFVVNVLAGLFSLALAYGLLRVFADREILRFAEELLRVGDVSGVEVLALPFAFSLGMILGTLALIALFERDFGGFTSLVARTFWESLTAAGVAGAVAYGALTILGGLTAATTLTLVVFHGLLAGVVGILAASLTYAILGSVEMKELVVAVRTRFVAPPVSVPVQSTEETLA